MNIFFEDPYEYLGRCKASSILYFWTLRKVKKFVFERCGGVEVLCEMVRLQSRSGSGTLLGRCQSQRGNDIWVNTTYLKISSPVTHFGNLRDVIWHLEL